VGKATLPTMRRKWIQQIEAEADAFIRDFGVEAHSVACRWERETHSLMMARVWNRVALAVARKTESSVAADPSEIQCLCARTSKVQYRIQFLDDAANVIREWSASVGNVAGAIELVVDADWPRRHRARPRRLRE
jgi:hypothetical protein